MQPRTVSSLQPEMSLDELQKAEEKINAELVIERDRQLLAYQEVVKITDELKALHNKNPAILLENQKKAHHIAQQSLAEIKSKLVIGTVEMVAISASLCALTLFGLASTDLFVTLLNYKIQAMLTLSSVVGSSGYLGWIADKKAALNTRVAQDHVKAAQNEVNTYKILYEEHEEAIKQKKDELNKAQQDLTKINANMEQLNKKAQEIASKLNQAQRKISVQQNPSSLQHGVFPKPLLQVSMVSDISEISKRPNSR